MYYGDLLQTSFTVTSESYFRIDAVSFLLWGAEFTMYCLFPRHRPLTMFSFSRPYFNPGLTYSNAYPTGSNSSLNKGSLPY